MSDYELEDAHFGAGSEPAVYDEPDVVMPSDDASEEEWQAWLEADEEPEQEPEQEPVDPFEYPQEGPSIGAVEEGIVGELRRQGLAEAFASDLGNFVAEAASREGVQDPQVVGRLTGEILQAREGIFKSWLAEGATISQAIAGLDDLDFEGAIAAGLAQERYQQVTNADSSLSQWRQGRAEQALRDQREGRQPQPDVFDSPSLQRMRASMEARQERMAQQQAIRRAHGLPGTSGW